MQYWFDSGREHKVLIRSHGNSKKRKQSFCRTHPSTMKVLKEEAQNCPPKEAVSIIYEEKGGIMGATCLGELPRNRDQVSNMCRTVNSKLPLCSNKGLRDPLFMVMEQCKLCESGDKFVRVVTASPEPMCILATDQQLNDLVRFATNPNKFCVISIDPTFSLGDFSVTCIILLIETYLLLTLELGNLLLCLDQCWFISASCMPHTISFHPHSLVLSQSWLMC